MNYEEIKSSADKDMKQAVESFESRIANIKAGRASEAVLDGITFSYFGNETPINQAATITIPEARLLVIKPWDKTNVGPIEKAIIKADIGIKDGVIVCTDKAGNPDMMDGVNKKMIVGVISSF